MAAAWIATTIRRAMAIVRHRWSRPRSVIEASDESALHCLLMQGDAGHTDNANRGFVDAQITGQNQKAEHEISRTLTVGVRNGKPELMIDTDPMPTTPAL